MCGRRSLTFTPNSPQLPDTGSQVDDEDLIGWAERTNLFFKNQGGLEDRGGVAGGGGAVAGEVSFLQCGRGKGAEDIICGVCGRVGGGCVLVKDRFVSVEWGVRTV